MTLEAGGRIKRVYYTAQSASCLKLGQGTLAVRPGGGSAVSNTAMRTRTLLMLFWEVQALISLNKKKKEDEKVI